MLKILFFSLIIVFSISCGVKKPPTPLYSMPKVLPQDTPSPTPKSTLKPATHE